MTTAGERPNPERSKTWLWLGKALGWAEHTLPPGSTVLVQSLYDRTFDNVPIVTDKTIERLGRVLPTTGSFGRVRQEVLDSWQARPVYRDVGWSERQSELERSMARYVFITEAHGPPPPERLAWLERSGRLLRRFEPDVPWPLKADQNWRDQLPVMRPSLSIYELDPAGP